MNKIGTALSKAYWWFLWLAGCPLYDEELKELIGTGDRITYWFRRSKKRLGNFWWLAIGFTLLILNLRLYTAIKQKAWGWVIFTACMDVFCVWLIPHVLGVW